MGLQMQENSDDDYGNINVFDRRARSYDAMMRRVILMLDFCKEYDTVVRGFLFVVHQRFGFFSRVWQHDKEYSRWHICLICG